MTTVERVALNIERKYGEGSLKVLIDALQSGARRAEIALAFDVTEQRVNQWAGILGERLESYIVHADMKRIADEPDL